MHTGRLFLFLDRRVASGGFGHQLLGLPNPITLLDGAVERQRLVDVCDIFVREIGDLVEFDTAELDEARGDLWRDAGDLRQLIRRALRLLEALPGRSKLARA